MLNSRCLDSSHDCQHPQAARTFDGSSPLLTRMACGYGATVQFEDCIREAVRLSGCHHEVDYLVTLMMTKTRELLSHMYSTNCWYRCSPAAAASTPFAPAGLVAVVLVVLWRT
ncbi:uncharacterized protein LOC119431332 isoform X5 [Dermacentor silvarum]|uniref:uncharacterized protein LOC119431332 isoform X5 n=1 Tax=Dermacentor silvarum TaxID=543639 RepID=UPI002100DF22|nr:uncharacterized protein LOC119431332 isoform X5 [Dermacentor silvarum]